jgi:AraC family transcriptional regulator
MALISDRQRYWTATELSTKPAYDFLYITPSWLTTMANDLCDMSRANTNLKSSTNLHLYDEVLRSRARAYLNFLRSDSSSQLLGDTLRHMLGVCVLQRHTKNLPKKRLRANALPLRSFMKVNDYVDAFLHQPMWLAELSALACLSEHHFLRSFKLATGLTPHQFVLGKKLERAEILLKKTRLPISQIAIDAGFASQSHMTQTFSVRRGVTPANYRLQS